MLHAEIFPDRCRNNKFTGKLIQNISKNIADNAYLIDIFIFGTAQTVEIAEIVPAGADIQNQRIDFH